MIVLAGLNHKTAPVKFREALAGVGALKALEKFRTQGDGERVVLSTCNRFELYTVDSDEEKALERLTEFMKEICGKSLEGVHYRRAGLEAVRHLFTVAAGLDSLVVGESEILGQVKEAYETSRKLGFTGKIFNVLFQRALFVGKLVRSETGISTGQTSVASVAVQLAQRIFGSLSDSKVLILGAGKMAELSARHLLNEKVKKLWVANRTWGKGVALAEPFNAEPIRWQNFPQAMEEADVVIASTGSEKPVLTVELVRSVLSARRGRSLFLIDIAMPRDVEEGVHRLEHVYLYTLEDLRGIVDENVSRRKSEFERARGLVEQEVRKFCSDKMNGMVSALA
ncbi:MAG: glutamyl-tRNA reductase [Elusimicrobia bacterium]|nr:glutamyl-tRNA reductase [Elusimicrobiota bacterium]